LPGVCARGKLVTQPAARPVEQVGVHRPLHVCGCRCDQAAGNRQPDGGVCGQGDLATEDFGGGHVLGGRDRARVIAVVVEHVDGDAVTAEQGDGGGVDVDVVEGDHVTDVCNRDPNRGAVATLDPDTVALAADAALLG